MKSATKKSDLTRDRRLGRVLARTALSLAAFALLVCAGASRSQNARSKVATGSSSSAVTRHSSLATRHFPFEVHEWGTFVGMQGSDGVTLDGLHHEEADLPSFVFSRSRDQIRHLPAPPSKLETPVIYFYAAKPMQVNVRVDFPRGVFTQWYPDVSMSGPRMQQTDLLLKDGMLQWNKVQLTPALREDASGNQFPLKSPASIPNIVGGNHYGAARAVDADHVTINGQSERFLFYRGLGRVEPLLASRVEGSQGGKQYLSLNNLGVHPMRGILLMNVTAQGGLAYHVVRPLAAGAETRMEVPTPKDGSIEPALQLAEDQLASYLMEAGLFSKEALAMIDTWEKSYFRTPGLRILYVVPQEVVDEVLPLRIDPEPDKIVRVIVGRLECLTPEREQAAERAVRDLASSEESTRSRAFTHLVEMGRFAEPILRRVAQSTNEPDLKARCERILHAEALATIRHAASLPVPDRLSMQARLASSYRQFGMKEEARAIGERVLAELHSRPEPKADAHVEQRRYLRALSLATEATGDDSGALEALTRNVQFAARINEQVCQNCHSTTNATPRRMADLRDWWGRSKFIEVSRRTGKTEAMRAELREKIMDTAAPRRDVRTLTAEEKGQRLLYLYLCEAAGREDPLVSPTVLWKRMLALDEAKPIVAAAR